MLHISAYEENSGGKTQITRRSFGLGVAAGLTAGALGLSASTAQAAEASAGRRPQIAHHDVLFVGAHPDDEPQNLSTFGQWQEYDNLSTGVITITRGGGGGNAVGPEAGAPLGQIREGEERKALACAGIFDIFYLDKPDFWYTLSASLTADIWGADDTLERIVRLVRETTPHTTVTMDPPPVQPARRTSGGCTVCY